MSEKTTEPTRDGQDAISRRVRKGANGQRPFLFLAIIVGMSLSIFGGYRWYTRAIESTDDAHVEADVVPVSARVAGQVVRVAVRDNQVVKEGDLLLQIDPVDYVARKKQALAELEVARAEVRAAEADLSVVDASSRGGLSSARAGVASAKLAIGSADAQVEAAKAAVERAKIELKKKRQDAERARKLAEEKTISADQLESALTAEEASVARMAEAQAQLAAVTDLASAARSRVYEARGRLLQNEPVQGQEEKAAARLALARARVESAQAAFDLATIAQDRTQVRAPIAGRLSRIAVREGQLVQAGQLIVNLVPDFLYVVANFKETQVGAMKAGQRAEVEIDAYPGRVFTARVESIAPGTGARFSLLPSDNATGNFVKVVQRVPVKLVWNDHRPNVRLEPGLSVIVKVKIQ
jgi:membrane fusion protein (multidrug efflux system)